MVAAALAGAVLLLGVGNSTASASPGSADPPTVLPDEPA